MFISHLGSIWHQVPVPSCDGDPPAADLSQDLFCCVLRAAGKRAEPDQRE